jgi:hypothetical protein
MKAPTKRIPRPPPPDDAILKRGQERPWATRTRRGLPYQADVFDYITQNYLQEWPNITAAEIARADPQLYAYYKTRKARVGVPEGFKLSMPRATETEVDPKRAAWREIERDRKRRLRQKQRES